MDISFHYLLMVNQAILHKKLLTDLKDTGLTLGQPKVLDYLKEHNGASQKEIASGCHIEAASLTSVLNRMEEKNMIERRILNGNRRSFHIFLTETGREFQIAVEQSFLSLEEKAFQGITTEERMQFMKIFLQIYKNMADKDPASDCEASNL